MKQRGFTLLEIMVAFAIMALSTAVLLQAFGSGAHLLGDAALQSRAVSLARSQLVRVGTEWPLDEGERTGEWQRYRWRVNVSPYELEEAAADLRLLQVTVEVRWHDSGHERRYRLSTLRLAPSP